MKPTVPEVLPIVRSLYASPGGGSGCCWHIVLDDVNVDDDSVRFCVETVTTNGCQREECRELVGLLPLMSRTQRRKLATSRHDP